MQYTFLGKKTCKERKRQTENCLKALNNLFYGMVNISAPQQTEMDRVEEKQAV